MTQLRRAPRVPWEGEPEHSVPAACLKHPSWLTGLLLGRKPRSREPQGQASPLLFGPDAGCHLCPSGSCWGRGSLRNSEGGLSPQVTCRALGIGAYLVRLGQRVIQVENSHIILTGASALNKVTAKGLGRFPSPRPLVVSVFSM